MDRTTIVLRDINHAAYQKIIDYIQSEDIKESVYLRLDGGKVCPITVSSVKNVDGNPPKYGEVNLDIRTDIASPDGIQKAKKILEGLVKVIF